MQYCCEVKKEIGYHDEMKNKTCCVPLSHDDLFLQMCLAIAQMLYGCEMKDKTLYCRSQYSTR